jgi:D-serine deaminase-like pyridoxal phosphate-dependent protein
MTQAAFAFGAGAQRVLVANEMVSPTAARAVVKALAPGDRELYCLVDSVAGAELFDYHLGQAGLVGRLGVLIELGAPGGRSGARSEDEAVVVAAAVGASAHLRLVGVEGYEGDVAADRSPESLAKVDRYLERLRDLVARLGGTRAFSPPGPGPRVCRG